MHSHTHTYTHILTLTLTRMHARMHTHKHTHKRMHSRYIHIQNTYAKHTHNSYTFISTHIYASRYTQVYSYTYFIGMQ